MRTPVVMLNGSPSAGKTTLAAALQTALPYAAFHLSLDEFRTGVRTEFWTTARVPGLFSAFVRAHLVVLDAVAAEGVPVITETIILPEIAAHYAPFFERHDVTLVGVRCALPVARQRERGRTDRRNGPIELDVPEFELVHQQPYALEVDTATEPTAVSVARIVAHLEAQGPPPPTALPAPAAAGGDVLRA